MSKSDVGKYSKILLTTPPDEIRLIISRAVTDSIPGVYASPERLGVTNLLHILAAFENTTVPKLENRVRNLTMREFKEIVAERIVTALLPIQSRYQDVRQDRTWLEDVKKRGNEKARQVANQRITEIKEVIGLL